MIRACKTAVDEAGELAGLERDMVVAAMEAIRAYDTIELGAARALVAAIRIAARAIEERKNGETE